MKRGTTTHKNLPATEAETALTPTDYLIFRTSLEGRIVSVNPAFVCIGGCSHEELMGAPHNLVRHPDMLEAVFTDLWATPQTGKVWRGFAKNQRKGGGFYWVLASVTPVFQNNAVVGYASMRSVATSMQIARAQRAYTAINEDDTSYTVRTGHILRTGWRRAVSLFQIDSLRSKVIGLQTLIVSTILTGMV